jgi:hypothetical protein
MGELFDDIGRLWSGPGSQAGYEFAFLAIAYDGDKVRITATGQLSDSDPQQAAILQRLKTVRRSPPAKPPRTKSKPVQVPFHHIAKHVYARLRARLQERPSLGEATLSLLPRPNLRERSDELHKFVVQLNGRFPDAVSYDVWRICEFSGEMDQDEIEALIVDAREEAAKELNIDLRPNEYS